MPSEKLKKFCKKPTSTNYLAMPKKEQQQFNIIAKLVVAKKFKLEKNPQQIVDAVIKNFGIFNNFIPIEKVENEVIQAMKEKLKKMSKAKQKETVLALRMYTLCFDRVINELLNQHYKGNKVTSFPIIDCILDGEHYHSDFTANEFGTYYKDICTSLQYPRDIYDLQTKLWYKKTSKADDANLLAAFVKHAKAAYPYIIKGCVEFPETVRLYRGMKIEKGTPFDVNNYVNNSLSSCTSSYDLAVRFATSYFADFKTEDDYDLYIYDIYFPPGTKMISPGACALQDEHEIIICNRFTCEVVSIKSISMRSIFRGKLVKCIAHVSSIVDKITNTLILHDGSKHGQWKPATG